MYITGCISNAKENKIKDHRATSLYQSENVKVKRRIFFYDDDILRNHRDQYFKESKGGGSILCGYVD